MASMLCDQTVPVCLAAVPPADPQLARARFEPFSDLERLSTALGHDDQVVPRLMSLHYSSSITQPSMSPSRNLQESSTTMSHTQRCREKVKQSITQLRKELPMCSTKLKRKAQILSYALNHMQNLLKRREFLRRGIILSTLPSFAQWAEECSASSTADSVLFEFAKMYAAEENWKVCEVWSFGHFCAHKAEVSGSVQSSPSSHSASVELVTKAFASKVPIFHDNIGVEGHTALAFPACDKDRRSNFVLLFVDDSPRVFLAGTASNLKTYTETILKVHQQAMNKSGMPDVAEEPPPIEQVHVDEGDVLDVHLAFERESGRAQQYYSF